MDFSSYPAFLLLMAATPFPSSPIAPQWNDYLEQREDIAFNLVEGIDQAETEERLRRAEVENADTIAANRAKEVEMEDAARPKASAMQIAEEEPELPEMAGVGGLAQAELRHPAPRAPPLSRTLRDGGAAGSGEWAACGRCAERCGGAHPRGRARPSRPPQRAAAPPR